MDKNLSLIDGTFENAAAIYRASKLQERVSKIVCSLFLHYCHTNKLNLVQVDKEYVILVVILYFEQILPKRKLNIAIW